MYLFHRYNSQIYTPIIVSLPFDVYPRATVRNSLAVMKKSLVITLLAVSVLPNITFSQTGPGGISDNTGSLDLWFDSKRVNANGSNPANGAPVTTWYDKSGNNYSATANAANVATYSANGVVFANNGWLQGSDAGLPAGGGSRSVFLVASSPSSNADDVLFFYGTGNDDESFGLLKITSGDGAAPNGVRFFFYGNDQNVANGLLPSGTAKIITATFNTTGDVQSVQLNNAAAVTRNADPPNTVLGGANGLNIGGWTRFQTNSQATISEIILHDVLLDAADIIIMNNYLSAKYNLTLSANDLYDNDVAGNGNFDFDVAGIGRASATAANLDAQSSIVRINDAASLGSGDYYIFGHDNGSLLPTNSNVPATVQRRLTRIWRASETGTITNFDVHFQAAGLGAVTASDLRLLIDTNNDGSFADEGAAGVISGATLVGGYYQFLNVTGMNDDLRFTLGSINATQTPLPVTFASFSAVPENRQVKLTWETAHEKNNEYFEVMRSQDGEVWDVVTTLDGAGNSSMLLRYEAEDQMPYDGKNLYRIRQVDYDGNAEFSEVVAAEFRYSNDLFPNPTTGHVTLTFSEDNMATRNISIFSTFGVNMSDRATIKQLTSNQFQIDLSSLPPGVYVVQTPQRSWRVNKQ